MTFFHDWKTGYLVEQEEDEQQTYFFLIIISKWLFERERKDEDDDEPIQDLNGYDRPTAGHIVGALMMMNVLQEKWIIFSRNPKLFLHFFRHYASRDIQWCYYVNISGILPYDAKKLLFHIY